MSKLLTRLLTISLFTLSMFGAAVQAAPTDIEVAVLAHGAKFIGDGTGGARITIADAETGKVLAEGVTRGGTGDTQLIMKQPQPHWEPIFSEGAASYVATLDIAVPRHLAITASGPLDAAEADQVRASTTTWLLPGEHRRAESAVVIELSGYYLQVLDVSREQGVSVEVDVGMLCGCPVVPGGLWDADAIDMHAVLSDGSGSETTELQHVEGTRYRAVFSRAADDNAVVAFHLRGRNDANASVIRHPL